MTNQIITFDPATSDETPLHRAAAIIRRGGVIAFPTDTSYGLGADPFNRQAVARIYRLKGRSEKKPILVLISRKEQLHRLVRRIPRPAEEVIRAFWPGPLTLIFEAQAELADCPVAAQGKIGIRLPANPITRRLIDLTGIPITATSANPSGRPSPWTAETVREYFPQGLELILDAGEGKSGHDSTILDVTEEPPRLVRPGAVSQAQLERVIRLT